MVTNMVAGQNLHPLTSSPESVGYSADMHQYLQNATQQMWADKLRAELTILKGELENDELKAQIATLEGKLQIQHRNTPSCPLPSDSAVHQYLQNPHQQLKAKIAIYEGRLRNLHSRTTGPESGGLLGRYASIPAERESTTVGGPHHTKG